MEVKDAYSTDEVDTEICFKEEPLEYSFENSSRNISMDPSVLDMLNLKQEEKVWQVSSCSFFVS